MEHKAYKNIHGEVIYVTESVVLPKSYRRAAEFQVSNIKEN